MKTDSADALRRLCDEGESALRIIPSNGASRSRRRQEVEALRNLTRPGGRDRAGLYEDLSDDLVVLHLHVAMCAHGVADLFEVGRSRDRLNTAAVNAVMRAGVELVAELRWLLDGKIDAEERLRRYLTYRFADLADLRSTLESLPKLSGVADVDETLRPQEEALVEVARKCGWIARPRGWNNGNPAAAALLQDDGNKTTAMPSKRALVSQFAAGHDSFYPIVSAGAHGRRWGRWAYVTSAGNDPETERELATFSAFTLKAGTLYLTAAKSVLDATVELLDWSGVARPAALQSAAAAARSHSMAIRTDLDR